MVSGQEGDAEYFGRKKFMSISTTRYSEREKLMSCIREIASTHGFAAVIKKLKKDCYVRVGCDRGGEHRINKLPIKQRDIAVKRTSGTRSIECPFEIWGRCKSDGFWEIEIKNLTHNHSPSSDMSGHPIYRRFSENELIRIREMTMSGIATRQSLTSLRQGNTNLQSISRSIYNARAKIRKESLHGCTMIQALFQELGQGEFQYNVKHYHNGHLTHLFIAHPSSITLTKSYSSIFLMDCTYKTNKYRMPLLNIVGVTSFNTTFFSAVVFLQKEEVTDYEWALDSFQKMLGLERQPLAIVTDRELALMNAIKVIFPNSTHLLCVWHIEKNIMAKCKKIFRTKDDWEEFITTWTDVIRSPEEESFLGSWNLFVEKYKDHTSVITYIEKTWLPYKEKFIYAWTNKVTHFGNHVTSRVEGAHSKLKRYLQVSTGDLRGVKDKICLVIDNEFHEIKARLSSEKIRIAHKFQIPLFKQLIGHVSAYALGELLKQYELARSNILPPCRGNFTSSMGLPCAHIVRAQVQPLQLDDIHPQWRLDKRCLVRGDNENEQIEGLLEKVYDNYQRLPMTQKKDVREQVAKIANLSVPPTLEPRTYPHKGRPTGSLKRRNESSTTRDPSLFEIVENAQKHTQKIIMKGSILDGSVGSSSDITPANFQNLFLIFRSDFVIVFWRHGEKNVM